MLASAAATAASASTASTAASRCQLEFQLDERREGPGPAAHNHRSAVARGPQSAGGVRAKRQLWRSRPRVCWLAGSATYCRDQRQQHCAALSREWQPKATLSSADGNKAKNWPRVELSWRKIWRLFVLGCVAMDDETTLAPSKLFDVTRPSIVCPEDYPVSVDSAKFHCTGWRIGSAAPSEEDGQRQVPRARLRSLVHPALHVARRLHAVPPQSGRSQEDRPQRAEAARRAHVQRYATFWKPRSLGGPPMGLMREVKSHPGVNVEVPAGRESRILHLQQATSSTTDGCSRLGWCGRR